MKMISSFSEIDFLGAIVGATLQQIILDPYGIRFVFDSCDGIEVESTIIYVCKGERFVLNLQDERKRAFDFYSILDKKVVKSFSRTSDTWNVYFDNNVHIEIVTGQGLVESVQGIFRHEGTFDFVI